MRKILLRAAALLILLFFLTGCGLFTAVLYCSRLERAAKVSDCLIVLGARVWESGVMSDSLRYRCEAALEAWQSGLAEYIICCGAQGSDEPISEGEAMAAYFVENGVPEEYLIVETESTNTEENLANAKAIMDERGWTSAVVVTSDYHLQRALWLAADAGIDACGIAAQSPKLVRTWITGRLRESVSWVLYAIRKIL